jgi:GNAT superfamily N-acetyltransferase
VHCLRCRARCFDVGVDVSLTLIKLCAGVFGGNDYLLAITPSLLTYRLCKCLGVMKTGNLDIGLIGVVFIYLIDAGSVGFIFGLRIHPSYSGQGLGHITLQQAVRVAFRDLGVRSVQYTRNSQVEATGRMAIRAGFKELLLAPLIRVQGDGLNAVMQFAQANKSDSVVLEECPMAQLQTLLCAMSPTERAVHCTRDTVILPLWRLSRIEHLVDQAPADTRVLLERTDNSITGFSILSRGENSSLGFTHALFVSANADVCAHICARGKDAVDLEVLSFCKLIL